MSIRFNYIEAGRVKEPNIYNNFSFINKNNELSTNIQNMKRNNQNIEDELDDIITGLNKLASLFGSYERYDGQISDCKSQINKIKFNSYTEMNNLIDNINQQLIELKNKSKNQLTDIENLTNELRGEKHGN